MIDLVAAVRRGSTPPREALRGLGDAWRAAETSLLAEVFADPRRSSRRVAGLVRLARRCGEPEAIGRAARLHASALSLTGRHAASLAAYRVAERHLTGAARDGALIGRAVSLTRLGRWKDAVRVCRAARRTAEKRGDPLLAAAARMNEAVAHHEGGDAERALPLYREARAAFSSLGHPRHAGRAADAMANALVRLDRFEDALELYEAGAADLATAGLAREAAISRANRGELLAATDRLGEADAELEAAERALRACGDTTNAALARLSRGDALLRARLVPEARRLITTARRALGTAAPPAERARAALLAARAEIAAGEPAAARRILARPLALRSAALDAERDDVLGRAAAALGDAAGARRLLVRAAAGFARPRPVAHAGSLAAAAWCAAESGDVAGGRRLATSAERAAASCCVPSVRFSAAAARFAVELRAGDAARATTALARAFDALESLRAGLGPDAMRAALLRGSGAWFARAVRHVLDQEGAGPALALVERWRARALVDLVAAADRTIAPDAAVAGLRARLAALERRAAGETLPGFLRGTAVADAPRSSPAFARRAARDVAVAERALQAATDRLAPAPVVPQRDARTVAASLPPGTLVVSLFADDEGGLAFCADRDGVRVVAGLASAPEIASLAEELHFRIGKFALGADYAARHGARLAAETGSILAALADRTLAPIADAVRRAERLVVVPHGPWHRVPIAALPFDGAPLLAGRTVTAVPALAALDATVPRASGVPVVLAVPDARAPHIADEGRRVALAHPGSRLLVGDAATAAALDTDPPPSVVHVAAHGRFRADEPALSGVRLGDGWLRACEMPRLRLRGSTVVLSGCETGVSRVEAGDEVLGVVRGALAAGARDLVVSLWRVDDEATAALMADLHAGIARGLAPADALRAAQKSRWEKGFHPWLWAGFCAWTRSPG